MTSRRESGIGATEIIIGVVLLGLVAWILTFVHDYIQEVKYERKYGSKGEVIEGEEDPDQYTGPKGYQIVK